MLRFRKSESITFFFEWLYISFLQPISSKYMVSESKCLKLDKFPFLYHQRRFLPWEIEERLLDFLLKFAIFTLRSTYFSFSCFSIILPLSRPWHITVDCFLSYKKQIKMTLHSFVVRSEPNYKKQHFLSFRIFFFSIKLIFRAVKHSGLRCFLCNRADATYKQRLHCRRALNLRAPKTVFQRYCPMRINYSRLKAPIEGVVPFLGDGTQYSVSI